MRNVSGLTPFPVQDSLVNSHQRCWLRGIIYIFFNICEKTNEFCGIRRS